MNQIVICMGSSCFSRGNRENLNIIKEFIKINGLDTELLLKGCLCDGNCNSGPNLYINSKLFSNVVPDTINDVLDEILKAVKNVSA